MHSHADKSQGTQNKSIAASISGEQSKSEPNSVQVDTHSESVAQRNLQEIANNSPQVKQLQSVQEMADQHAAKKPTLQRKANQTGLPDNLKSGVESLSGYAMDDVKVHYNSAKPAQLNAHAFAQGTDIHVASGQEKHLAHEAWHVVQQKQGRVKATMQMKGNVDVNDDAGLEQEADIMGEKALNLSVADSASDATPSVQQQKQDSAPLQMHTSLNQSAVSKPFLQAKLKTGVLNVAGETHSDYDEKLRDKEKKLATKKTGGAYWTEAEFKVTETSSWYGTKKGQSGDPVLLQFLQTLELVDSYGGQHIATMDPTKADQAKVLRSMAENCVRVLTGGVKDRYAVLADEVTKDLVTLNDEQREAAGKVAGKIDAMKNNCLALYKAIKEDGSLDGGVTTVKVAELQKTCTDLNKDIKDQGAILNSKKAMTMENIRVPRSTQMHFSAQASFATPGIWKIGNNHFTDISEYIKGRFVGAPKYNLLGKDEFNDERDKFDPNA
jgi:hypothetical protein